MWWLNPPSLGTGVFSPFLQIFLTPTRPNIRRDGLAAVTSHRTVRKLASSPLGEDPAGRLRVL